LSTKKFYKREDLIGKTVINQDASEIGTVKDTAFDVEGKMALIISKKDGQEEEYISINDIRSMNDVILLKENPGTKTLTLPNAQVTVVQAVPSQSKICPKCGHVNLQSAQFCVKCGNKLPV
jgi:sporulation protein YlmC with PRC-barrel domain/ribosomal protein L40E